MNSTTTRKGEVFRAQRRTSENVNLRASQHLIDIPVNKSVYNGYGGEQFSAKMQPKPVRGGQPKLRIIPIGGVGEMGIGKNMNAIEYDDEIIIVDMGFLFPGSDYPASITSRRILLGWKRISTRLRHTYLRTDTLITLVRSATLFIVFQRQFMALSLRLACLIERWTIQKWISSRIIE